MNKATTQTKYLRELLGFLENSPTAFHAVRNISQILRDNGFRELQVNRDWEVCTPGAYFVQCNGSSLIMFTLGHGSPADGFRMAGAHTDSPGLKIKPRPAKVVHGLMQLGVETYGGVLPDSWLDRDLSLAGMVTWQGRDGAIHNSLVDLKRPVAVIPSLAIHLSRDGEERKINKQTDLVPIIMEQDEKQGFETVLKKQLASEHGAEQPEILGHELFLYDSQPPALIGVKREFITGGRLDNLLSCFALVRGMVEAGGGENALVVLTDHEEVGSLSHCGASGPFLRSVLERLLPDGAARRQSLYSSLMISADNAHAVHPNFADKHDQNHLPGLNRGVVIKYNANQRYATTGRTAAFYRLLSERAGAPVQEFVMRSDMACGTTIGPVTAGGIGVQTIDVGVPSLAMHSIREMAGAVDSHYLYLTMREYFTCGAGDNIWQCLAG